ncbi:phosphatidylglycerophosphatase A [candidate division KSB1 bacterium]|nr:phosphatidylglycerophosphatase A [candidate division KSB1 bacterium]
MRLLIRFVATTLGVGYSPVGPGTCGAIVACLFYWYVFPTNVLSLSLIVLCTFFLGVLSATQIENEDIELYGAEKGHDPQIVVIDEFVGMLIALLALPKTIPITIVSFILFRFFDIVKPFPIKQSQMLPSGWGIMMDDVLAGVFSNVIIQLYYALTLLM